MSLYRLSPEARDDLDQIWDFIATDDPTAATRSLSKIGDRLKMLARQPLIGESREELAPKLRDFPVGNYVIYYKPTESGSVTIEIIRVIHGARDVHRLF